MGERIRKRRRGGERKEAQQEGTAFAQVIFLKE
jgi:hypothetical protein